MRRRRRTRKTRRRRKRGREIGEGEGIKKRRRREERDYALPIAFPCAMHVFYRREIKNTLYTTSLYYSDQHVHVY